MIYEIVLESLGEITLLPDSQKLFGFLMAKLNENFDKQSVSDFVDKVHVGEIKCMVSNLFPKGYIPFPKSYVLAKSKEKSKEVYKLIKGMEYIEEKNFKYILNLVNEENEEIRDAIKENVFFVSPKQKYSQKFKLESKEKGLPGLPNRAYSLPILEFYINQNMDVEKCKEYSFFIKVDEESILGKYMEKYWYKKELEIVCELGSKASHGYNIYKIKNVIRTVEIESLEEVKDEKNYIYLNMGMLLPNIEKIKSEGSFLEIHSSNRKSYEISDSVEKVISFISPGSVINVKNLQDINDIGKCIPNKYNLFQKNAIVFGNSFIKKLEVTK